MKRRTILAIAMVIAATLGMTSVAYALWSDDAGVQIPDVAMGAVSFDAYTQSEAAPQYSPDGSPVTVTLPAAEILKVLDQTGVDPEPVIWRFTVEGYAQGIAGMNLSISMGDQIGPNGMVTDLGSGTAREGTILGMSTVKVYPASVNGDCSSVPDTPKGDDTNLYVYAADDHVLQSPGAYAGGATTEVWCVAMDFHQTQDGVYANEVQAIGTGEDGTRHASLDRWDTIVSFPPSPGPLGFYRNRVDVVATAEDGTQAHAHDIYEAMLDPDPNAEPDVTIILDPTVTNLNSGFSPT